MPRANRARQKANALLERMRTAVGTRPTVEGKSIAELAAQAGVSYSTMWRALNGQPTATHKKPPSTVSRSAWLRTYDELRRRIDAGVYSRGTTLPTTTALCHDVGVHYRTMRKALRALVENGYIVASGSHYAVPQAAVTSRTAAILCILRGSGPTEVMPVTARFSMLLRDLELACTHRGIHLHLHTVYFDNITMRGIDTLHKAYAVLTNKHLLGTVVLTLGLPRPETLIHRALSTGPPLAVLDEYGLTDCYDSIRHSPKLHWYRMGTDVSEGEAVGRYLLSMGHRVVGYLAHETDLVAPRHIGLRGTVEKRGGTVIPLPLPDIAPQSTQTHEVNRNERLAIRAINDSGIVPPRHSHDIRLLYRWRSQAVRNIGRRAAIIERIAPMLRNTALSALVSFNDELAVLCKEALADYPSIARRLSLISFDDCPDAANHRLTSYNFNTAAYISHMLEALINHRSRPRRPDRRRREPIVLPGFVTERGSVRLITEPGEIQPAP
ncbi:MAG: GntR family transcriptional regulator [Chitinivibrionales bacterium]|nr:GntR family transcriptional regulator [Chitinivibrionales bacterium]